MFTKICGITNLEDALTAAGLGAGMLGFNFYPKSKRYITLETCLEIQDGLARRNRKVITVGVFVNTPGPEIEHILDTCGLDLAQLSGDETPSDLHAIAARAFKGIRPRSAAQAEGMAVQFANPGLKPALLIDAYHPAEYGGTGRTGDWGAARALAVQYPLLLAGGLKPGNVAAAIAQVNPWGVDVASGVESDTDPRKKDPEKLKHFIRNAKNLNNSESFAPK